LVAIRITVWIQGLFSGFDTSGRYGKHDWAAITTSLRHRSVHDIATATALHAACSVAEVCTVPVFLVLNLFNVKENGATLQRRDAHLSFIGINQVALRRPGYYWNERPFSDG